MKQEKLEPDSKFAERSTRVAQALGLRLEQMPERLGISPATFYAARGNDSKTSDKTWRRLEKLEAELRLLQQGAEPPVVGVEESQRPYGASSGPTRAELEARFRAFLDAAEKVPGGLGYASVQMSLHLDATRLSSLDPAYDPAAKLRAWWAEKQAKEQSLGASLRTA
jgi:hypothetical protein